MIALHRPYLSDTADPSVVAEWKRKAGRSNQDARGAIELHELAVRVLVILLHCVDLYVAFPKRMTSREEKRRVLPRLSALPRRGEDEPKSGHRDGR